MTIDEIWKLVKKFHGKLGIKRIPPTSVVSPLFPGQFNYCLDERHFLEKYNSFIKVKEEHFQKMMPVLRLADFDSNLLQGKIWSSPYHLSCFTMTTIGGGHVIPSGEGVKYYEQSVKDLLSFLCEEIGLDKTRLFISYFDGTANLKEIEGSRKKLKDNNYLAKILSDFIPEGDFWAQKYFIEYGIPQANLQPCNTRDCFLTTNWDITSAPMGYRNEIHYKLDNGYLLDVATIEFLVFEPIIEIKSGTKFVVGIKPWDMNFVISGLGLERLVLAKEGINSIYELKEFKSMTTVGLKESEIEAIRILHRVLTDIKWEEIDSSSRRSKLNKLIRHINNVSLDDLLEVLKLNAAGYSKIFPELKESIPYLISFVAKFRIKG